MRAAGNIYWVTIMFKSTQEHARNVADALRMHPINLKVVLWLLFAKLILKAIAVFFLKGIKTKQSFSRWESCLMFRAGRGD